MSRKENPDPDPIVVQFFDELYNEYVELRPWLLKMGIKANRLPERDYLGPIIYRFTLKRLDKTKTILEKFKKTVFTDWMKIRKENSEEVWNFHEMMSPENDHFAEVVALKEASKKCQEFWFQDEDSVFVKEKKKAKSHDDPAREEDVGRMRDTDQEAGTGSEATQSESN